MRPQQTVAQINNAKLLCALENLTSCGGMSAGISSANCGQGIGRNGEEAPLTLKWSCDSGDNAIRSFHYNHGGLEKESEAVDLFHGDVAGLLEKTEADASMIYDTDLLLLEPPCQNYSRMNRSQSEERYSDGHPNVKALWDGLQLWARILPPGMNLGTSTRTH